MRFFGILTVALFCAFGLTANAQEQSKEKIKVKGEGARTTSYTGCVATGTETTTYLLNSAVPVTKTVEQSGTAGTITTTTTTYVLEPGSDAVTFTKLVGHKVEVTGVLIPAGKETKVKSKTEIEREGAPDIKIDQRTKTDHVSMPHFRVVSVKQLPDPCTP
jgi:hypothetical protein